MCSCTETVWFSHPRYILGERACLGLQTFRSRTTCPKLIVRGCRAFCTTRRYSTLLVAASELSNLTADDRVYAGEGFRRGRRERKMAAKLGVDPLTLMGWRAGRHEPTGTSLDLIGRVLQIARAFASTADRDSEIRKL